MTLGWGDLNVVSRGPGPNVWPGRRSMMLRAETDYKAGGWGGGFGWAGSGRSGRESGAHGSPSVGRMGP